MANQEENSKYTIVLFYKYTAISDPEAVKNKQMELCKSLHLKGRVIVATEGINATLEGLEGDIQTYCEEISRDERFKNIHSKLSSGTGSSFPKLSIKVRDEIVSSHFGEDDFDPNEITGKRLKPEELHEWLQNGEVFHIVDMRNDYEHKVGHFENSILPPLHNFRDLPHVVQNELADFKDKKVLTVCTGGIRCEKASGYLVKKGFDDVYQLDGGIVSYMEKFPNEHFKGKLYVFDNRITMGFNTDDPKHEIIGRCERCGTTSENYVNCGNDNCHKHFIFCTSCVEAQNGEAYCPGGCHETRYHKNVRTGASVI